MSERRCAALSPARSNSVRSVVGPGCVERAIQERTRQQQDLVASRAWRDDLGDVVGVENRAHATAVARQEARQRGRQIYQHGLLGLLRRAKAHGRTEVEQKPGGQFPILGVLAHVQLIHARGHVPVDVADIVLGLIFAQVGEVDAAAVEERAVVALKETVQATDDAPLQAREDLFGRQVSVQG